jgi:hypothetical protein
VFRADEVVVLEEEAAIGAEVQQALDCFHVLYFCVVKLIEKMKVMKC